MFEDYMSEKEPILLNHLRKILSEDNGDQIDSGTNLLLTKNMINSIQCLFIDQDQFKTDIQNSFPTENPFPTESQLIAKTISSHLLDAFMIEGDIVIHILITRLFDHFYKKIMDI